MFSEENGMPRKEFPNGWKGESGLYAVGFTKRGIFGASMDARRIAEDIQLIILSKAHHNSALMAFTHSSVLPQSPLLQTHH